MPPTRSVTICEKHTLAVTRHLAAAAAADVAADVADVVGVADVTPVREGKVAAKVSVSECDDDAAAAAAVAAAGGGDGKLP
jgi:hypothetical protein